jgi:large subunit ribosomal protein L25
MSNLKAIKREKTSSGSNSKLRADGLIPAILYGGKDPNQNISVEKKAVKNIVNSDTFLSKVLELDIDGKKEKVIPREVAFHVVSEEPIHIDFMRIIAGKKIILEIPVKFINHPDSPGLKRGGVLNIVRRKVELKCPGETIPDDITIDLAGTDIGTSIKISSVKLPENVVPTIDRDFVIATVAAPTVMKEPEKPAEKLLQKVLKVKLLLKVQKQLQKMEKQLKKMTKQKMVLTKNLKIKNLLKKNN